MLVAASVVEVIPTQRLRVVVSYELNGVVDSVAAAHRLSPLASTFTETVTHTFAVPLLQLEAFMAALRERTAGRADIARLD